MSLGSREYIGKSVYGDADLLREESLLHDSIVDTSDQEHEVLRILQAVTEWVEHYCDRVFFPWTRTLYFDGHDEAELLVPDLISVTSIKEDEDGDLVYEKTWAAADHILTPYNAAPTTRGIGQPYTGIRVAPKGDQAAFTKGVKNFEIAGVWGYRDETETHTTSALNGTFTDTAASITVDTQIDIALGMTIKIDDEQMLVVSRTNTILGVRRGMNGTTAASHLDNAPISIQRVPRAVERAALIQTARIWVRAPSFEPYFVSPFLDPDVRDLLAGYRRPRV